MNLKIFITKSCLSILLAICVNIVFAQQENGRDTPKWLNDYKRGSVWQFEHKGAVYFYIEDVFCRDCFNYIYTAEGKKFCAPSGGDTGGGDGRCPRMLPRQEKMKRVR